MNWDYEKSSHNDGKCNHYDNNHCKGCVCAQLKRLDPGVLVDVYLSSGIVFIGLNFIILDPRNCCASFLESTVSNEPLIIDCKKIDAFRRSSPPQVEKDTNCCEL